MTEDYQNAKLIACEFLDLFHHFGGRDLGLRITEDKSGTQISVKSKLPRLPEALKEELDRLQSQIRRQPEMESYYSELLGSDTENFESTLIVAMLDQMTYSYQEEVLEVNLYRKKL